MPSVLDGLNPEQREAAGCIDGPLLVFAGAGSGKTRMLTHRVAHMVLERGIAPGQILAVTFTNKAAGEMRSRIEELIGPRARGIWMGTFHGICVRLLREFAEPAGLSRNFTIFDEDDRSTLLRRLYRELDVDPQRHPLPAVARRLSDWKNDLLDPEAVAAKYGENAAPPIRLALRVFRRYTESLATQNALDFDDLILRAVSLLEGHAEVRRTLTERLRYVLVDEYQDINLAQYRLVLSLVGQQRNLCVVGDDDQSIYGWRGARVEIILRFEEDFPEAKVVKLERNYRSTDAVLQVANAVIAKNSGRRPKALRATRPGGAPVSLHVAGNEQDEAFFVADLINAAVNANERKFGQHVVLYRTNAQSRIFEQVFTTLRVPYRMIGGLRFYERKEVKDVLAYLRALFNPADDVSLGRIINVPARGLGDKTLEIMAAHARARGLCHWEALGDLLADANSPLATAARRKLTDFHHLMSELRPKVDTLPVPDLIRAVLAESGYEAALQADGGIEASARLENLEELVTAATEMAELADVHGREALEQFLERAALVSDVDALTGEADAVVLMTLHSAKGLEFPVVFLVGLEEGLFPHVRSLDSPSGIEEERRLCYVGMTRAIDQLYLSHAWRRAVYGQTNAAVPSRFLREVPTQLLAGDQGSLGQRPAERWEQGDEDETANQPVDLSRLMSRQRRGAVAPAPVPAVASAEAPYKAGDKVRHATFGGGIVLNCGSGSEAEVQVAFEDHGIKRLLVAYAKLERA
jgi:DNA helicase-2/ATP-dependent DNA helicase PcrA